MPDIKSLVEKLHPLERKTIPHLNAGTMLQIAKASNLSVVESMRALQWLENKETIKMEHLITTVAILDTNGIKALKDGLPEIAFLKAVKSGATSLDAIRKTGLDPQEINACVGILRKNGRIDVGRDGISITNIGKQALEKPCFEEKLLIKLGKEPIEPDKLEPQEKFAFDNLKKRKGMLKLVETRDRKITITPLGKQLMKQDLSGEYADRLTPEDLKSGAWKDKKYRAYDVTINVPATIPGKQHFVNEAIEYIKQIWLELGFQEMEGDYVHNAFWDLDVLFVPQDHPAREMQDTLYLKKPKTLAINDKKLLKRVKEVHENGGDTGSDGWQYSYSVDEAERTMLRTHTTVISAQTLDLIRQGKKKMPGKYFIVDKVFRNEALDWKHLFEFYQVDGIVVDPDADFSHLLGYLNLFFKKLGYEKVRVRPAHFPYTEPSVEVDGWHPKKKEWVELGGAGLFRPEVTKTLIGEEVPVLAWGIGMARGISESFNITDIRELYANDLKQLRTMKRWVK